MSPSSSGYPTSRKKRPYDLLQPTEKWKRRKKAKAVIDQVVNEIGVPLDAITPPIAPSAVDVIGLTTAERERFRTVRSVHLPCEQTIIQCKKLLATTHATETGTFVNGAYITDPIRFVSVLCAQSSFIAVGGDKGDDLTKLGISYSVRGREEYRKLPNGKFKKKHPFIQHFAPLIVYKGNDDWEDMNKLTSTPPLTPFKGDSAAFPHIFDVLQHLIDSRKAYLNGDWCFINAVLGLMAPSATHPCPICIISFKCFTKSSRYREPGDKHSIDPSHRPLLTISSDRIVPTPLHVFLGISNRIILNALSELFSKELVVETLEKVKTIHSAGCGGKSDIFQLNGPEIRKWIKNDCSGALRTSAEAKGDLTAEQKSTYTTLQRWLENLHQHLLHKDDWEIEEIEEWRAVVDDLVKNWSDETGQAAFPKLHMLKHSLEFAERHHFLGRASEAQIESYHRTFKEIYNHQHLNSAHNESQRICRTLVDTTLRAVQPFMQAQL
jgi:hypothetical protein